MPGIRELFAYYNVAFNTSELVQGNQELDKTDKKIQDVDDSAGVATRTIRNLVAVIGGALTLRGMRGFVSSLVDVNRQLSDMARNTNLTNREATRLSALARLNGIETSNAITAIEEVQNRAREVLTDPESSYAAVFRSAGLSREALRGVTEDQDQLFHRLLQGIGRVTDTARQQSIANELGGDALAAFLPFARASRSERESMMEDVSQLTRSQQALNMAYEEARPRLDRLAVAWEEIKAKAMRALLPHLERILSYVEQFVDYLDSIPPESFRAIVNTGALLALLAAVTAMLAGLAGLVGLGVKIFFLIGQFRLIIGLLSRTGALIAGRNVAGAAAGAAGTALNAVAGLGGAGARAAGAVAPAAARAVGGAAGTAGTIATAVTSNVIGTRINSLGQGAARGVGAVGRAAGAVAPSAAGAGGALARGAGGIALRGAGALASGIGGSLIAGASAVTGVGAIVAVLGLIYMALTSMNEAFEGDIFTRQQREMNRNFRELPEAMARAYAGEAEEIAQRARTRDRMDMLRLIGGTPEESNEERARRQERLRANRYRTQDVRRLEGEELERVVNNYNSFRIDVDNDRTGQQIQGAVRDALNQQTSGLSDSWRSAPVGASTSR